MAILEFTLEPNLGAYEAGAPPAQYPPDGRPPGLAPPTDLPSALSVSRIHPSRQGESIMTFAIRVAAASGPGPHTARVPARHADQAAGNGATVAQCLTSAGFTVEVT